MPNPFITDRPVAREDLIDRDEESAALLRFAEAGHNCRLSGPRRYGKTSLLDKLRFEVEQLGLPTVMVDFFGVVSIEEVAVRIEEAYRESLQGALARWYAGVVRTWSPRIRVAPGGTGLEAGPRPEEQTQRLLHDLLDLPVGLFEKTGHRTVVVFDEFQDLLAASDNADGLLRSRIQRHRNEASYVFAGSHPGLMSELFDSRERPLYGQARPIQLGPLPGVALADYIGTRFEHTDRDVGVALDPLLDLVRGHPQRAMLVAHHLWELTPQGGTATEEIWGDARAAVFRELQETFERTWERLSVSQRRTLTAIAWIGPWGGGDTLFSHDTLERFKLKRATARDTRDALLRAGELERDESGGVRLVDPLMEAWIASGRRQLG
jgi:uncharacterized protein